MDRNSRGPANQENVKNIRMSGNISVSSLLRYTEHKYAECQAMSSENWLI